MVSQTNQQSLENSIEWVLMESSHYEKGNRCVLISQTSRLEAATVFRNALKLN